MSFIKKHYNPATDPMWVIGSIDHAGAIHHRHALSGGDVMHGVNESNGKRWRWNIWGQEYTGTRNPSHDRLSEEEQNIVDAWLVNHGYKKEITLGDKAPHEFLQQFQDVPAYKYKDVAVVAQHDGTVTRWPGKHKNVFRWWTLANGKRVGWNENPARGWSFPVI